jgi:hypothetical protein
MLYGSLRLTFPRPIFFHRLILNYDRRTAVRVIIFAQSFPGDHYQRNLVMNNSS